MNKKIICLTAVTLATTTVCSVVPNKYVNSIVSIEAHAASSNDITDITISDSSDDLDIYDNSSCKKDDKVDFGGSDTPSVGETYYVKTSKTRIKIDVSGPDDDYVRIYKGSKSYKVDSSIPIDSGDTTLLEIRVYENKYDDYTSKEQKDSKNYTRYKVRVKNTKSSSSHSSKDNDDSVYLSSIKLSDGEIDFSKKTKSYDINVPLSTDSIRIKAEPEDDNDTVKIDGYYVDDNDKWRQDVSLNEGNNTIKIEVEDDDSDDKRTYTLNIYRGKNSSSSNTTSAGTIDNKQDSIYLDDLVLDDGDTKLNFNKKVTSYAIDYKEDYDYIMVKAEPEDNDDQVRINDNEVDSDGWYKKRVSLKKGKNVIKIKVDNSEDYQDDDDDYKKRIYTLTVYRGTSEGTATGEKKEDSVVATEIKKTNQWVKVADKWQYNDASGNPIKNQKFYDKNYGKNYFLDSDGNMQIGFVTYAGNTYFADNDGGMHLGWVNINNNWYHFNNYTGVMDQGWYQDYDGKWYFLAYGSGVMAHDTYIGQYRLNSSGAWIK